MRCFVPVRNRLGKPGNDADESVIHTRDIELLAVYTKKAITKIGLRPYCSDNGPHRRGPTQYPATNTAIINAPTSLEKSNCRISCGTITEGAELAKVL